MTKIEYFVAIVDRTHEWGPTVERRLRRRIEDPYQVLGFRSTDQLLNLLDTHPLCVPLLAVADTDAVTPTPTEGLFASLKPVVGRCVPVYYSADPRPEVVQDLSQIAPIRLLARTRKNSIMDLTRIAQKRIEEAEKSTDHQLTAMYERYVIETKSRNISTVDGSDLSPLTMLREMARGTVTGRSLLQSMIPRSWVTRKQHGPVSGG